MRTAFNRIASRTAGATTGVMRQATGRNSRAARGHASANRKKGVNHLGVRCASVAPPEDRDSTAVGVKRADEACTSGCAARDKGMREASIGDNEDGQRRLPSDREPEPPPKRSQRTIRYNLGSDETPSE